MPATCTQVSCQGTPSTQSRWRQSPSTLGLPSAPTKALQGREGLLSVVLAGGGLDATAVPQPGWCPRATRGALARAGHGSRRWPGLDQPILTQKPCWHGGRGSGFPQGTH